MNERPAQGGAGIPCECASADGLEEPDISQVLGVSINAPLMPRPFFSLAVTAH